MSEAFVEFRGITKRFGGVTALDRVSLSIARGECHALMGENGAGKSTLGKVLAGIHRPNEGEVLIEGAVVALRSPADAAAAGIGMVHQELAFCPDLSVAENMAMGHYPRGVGFLRRGEMVRRARELLGQIGVDLDVRQTMRQLSTAHEQLVQIASAIGTGARVLVFDEPTSSLSEPEAQRLFVLIDELRRRGVTTIYVSHRMPEVFRLCDRISVLRDGKYAGTLDRADATQDKIVQMMIGRSVTEYFPHHLDHEPGEVLLEVRGLSSAGKFRDVSFQIRTGEIVGFAGLVGSGRSEIALAIFGLDPAASGEVILAGRPLRLGRVREAMRRGIGLVPEDRKRQGLVMGMSGRANFSLALLNPPLKGLMRMSTAGFLRFATERRGADNYFARLRVKTPSLGAAVQGMSGGNQQKVVLAKWLARDARLLIVDEPTRGVDVGAKAAIHELIDGLARGTGSVKEDLGEGGGDERRGDGRVGVMLISSELPEVLNLSTRILVMREGRMVGELGRREATQESVLRLMAGVEANGTGGGSGRTP